MKPTELALAPNPAFLDPFARGPGPGEGSALEEQQGSVSVGDVANIVLKHSATPNHVSLSKFTFKTLPRRSLNAFVIPLIAGAAAAVAARLVTPGRGILWAADGLLRS